MILLVLSIGETFDHVCIVSGFSIDYTVHVVHTFGHCLGRRREDKSAETLILMCNPVTHGAISTLLGVAPIGLREEFIMDTFFKMTLLVVVFGFLNGVVFLPVLLALFGPVSETNDAKSKKLADELETTTQELIFNKNFT